MATERNGPQLTWANVIGTFMAVAVITGGAVAYVRDQISALKDDIALLRSTAGERDKTAERRLDKIDAELIARNEKFPTIIHFNEFKKTMDDRWRTQAEINKQAIDAYLSARAFDAWKPERDRRLDGIERRLEGIEKHK